jgi:hypothetical protein
MFHFPADNLSHIRFISSSEIELNNVDSRPKLVAGSPEGFPGHIDGKLWEARMNHQKGFTVDDKGNIYVVDVMNMAIRRSVIQGLLHWLTISTIVYFLHFILFFPYIC